ncbi:CBS domain-containing protein [Nostocoides sp.]|uniref:CBS domain-containing protein n=1 Tax=Nostocoides sp. TaxID=1917966 RepID=UPI002CC47FE3|nr:CBS domain-containing protein [Tetrasphaera sp.]
MKISEVVRGKGAAVVTIVPDASVGELLALLAEHRIGAVVVSTDGSSVNGIVSERDVVRHLHSTGAGILQGPVSAIMTAQVRTASIDSDLDELESTMTEHRIRHVPVVIDGQLAAIVSIGDVVKNRIHTLQAERDQLSAYISS